MSNGWKKRYFGQLFEIKHGYPFKSEHFSNAGPFILLTPGNFYEKGGLKLKEQEKYYTGDFPLEYILQRDDLLIAMTEQAEGLLGSSILIPEGNKYLHNQRLGLVTSLNEAEIDRFFVYYLFNFNGIRSQIHATASGTKVRHTSPSRIYQVEVFLPPLPEQRKIVEILSSWDQAITLTERLIAAKQRRKKALMQQLLMGRRRFREFAGEWWEARLEEVSDIFFSNVDKIIDPKEISVKLCNYMDVYSNFYITNNLPFKMGSANKNEIEKFSLFKNDVIITKDSETPADIAHAAVVTENLKNTVCGYHLAIIRPNNQVVDGIFLMYYLNYPVVNNQFARLANGITRFGLTTSAIKHAKVKLPSLPEQRKIADVLQACDEEIELLEQKLDALKRQKKGLMQKLLTGQVRVGALTP